MLGAKMQIQRKMQNWTMMDESAELENEGLGND